jgi:hypothetical protein
MLGSFHRIEAPSTPSREETMPRIRHSRTRAIALACGLAGCTAYNPAYVPFGVGDAGVARDAAVVDLAGRDLAERDLAASPDLGGRLPIEVDVAEDASAWDVGESQDDEIDACDPQRRGKVSLAGDPQHRVLGAASIRVDYGPGASSYFQAVYPRTRDAGWDLSRYAALSLVVAAELPRSYQGFSPPGPTIVLCAKDGYRRLDPVVNLLPRDGIGWVPLTVPLDGGGAWRVNDDGDFDLGAVDSLEIHADPQRGSGNGVVRLWVDAVRFY